MPPPSDDKDISGLFPLDLYNRKHGPALEDKKQVKEVKKSAANRKQNLTNTNTVEQVSPPGLLQQIGSLSLDSGKSAANTPARRKRTVVGFEGEPRFLRSEVVASISVGQGAEGHVVTSKHPTFGLIAVKILTSAENGLKELRLAMKLRPHPNVVIVYGFLYNNATDTIPRGYVMETLYTSLEKVIHRTKNDLSLPEYSKKEAVEIIHKIGCGIHYLHEQGILHRDVKPANTLSSRDLATIKICDFGMSTTLNSTRNVGKGTYMYMAPEVIAKVGSVAVRYNQKCDVYSAAITFWEIIHKKFPYDQRMTGLTIAAKVLEGLRPSLERSNLNDNFKELLQSGWHQDPAKRPKIFELSNGLQNC